MWIYPYIGGCIHLPIMDISTSDFQGQVDISIYRWTYPPVYFRAGGHIHLIFPRSSGYIHIQVDVSTCLFKGKWIYPFTGGYIHLPILGMCGYIHTTFPRACGYIHLFIYLLQSNAYITLLSVAS